MGEILKKVVNQGAAIIRGNMVWYSTAYICDHLSLVSTSNKQPPIQNTKIFPVKAL